MGIPDHLTCLLQVKKQQLESDMEQWTGSKLGKEYIKAAILSPCLFTLHAEYIVWNAGLDEAQTRIKIARRSINNFRYADETTLMAESKELKSLLNLEESEKEWKSWLKAQHSENEDHGIWSHDFMANRWGNSGNSGWLYLFWAPKSLQMVISAMRLKDVCSLKEKPWQT